MISAEDILHKTKDYLTSNNLFIVKLEVSKNNVIQIELDTDDGIVIDQCIQFNRFLKEQYEEALEEYELNVSSPGADSPVLNIRQLPRAINKEVSVTTQEGEAVKGILDNVDIGGEAFNVTTTTKERIPGKKSKQTIVTTHTFNLKQIKKVTRVISFK